MRRGQGHRHTLSDFDLLLRKVERGCFAVDRARSNQLELRAFDIEPYIRPLDWRVTLIWPLRLIVEGEHQRTVTRLSVAHGRQLQRALAHAPAGASSMDLGVFYGRLVELLHEAERVPLPTAT